MISILFALQNLFSAKTETFIKVNPLMPGGNKKVTYERLKIFFNPANAEHTFIGTCLFNIIQKIQYKV